MASGEGEREGERERERGRCLRDEENSPRSNIAIHSRIIVVISVVHFRRGRTIREAVAFGDVSHARHRHVHADLSAGAVQTRRARGAAAADLRERGGRIGADHHPVGGGGAVGDEGEEGHGAGDGAVGGGLVGDGGEGGGIVAGVGLVGGEEGGGVDVDGGGVGGFGRVVGFEGQGNGGGGGGGGARGARGGGSTKAVACADGDGDSLGGGEKGT